MDCHVSKNVQLLRKGRLIHILVFLEGRAKALRIVVSRLEIASILALTLLLCLGVGNLLGDYLGAVQGGKQVGEFRAEVDRVRAYESQLFKRAAAFEATLLEASEDLSLLEQDASLRIGRGGVVEGVGGADFSTAPYISSSNRKKRPPAHLIEYVDFQIDVLRHFPLGLPVKGGKISSGYGKRVSPFNGRRHLHHGIDLSVDAKTPVYSVADGTIVYAGDKSYYGQVVIIDHGNGFETVYGHLAKALVKSGETVCRRQKLGLVGSTGRSTGPHLHYEIRENGKPRNPAEFLRLSGYLKLLT